jgi:hypothetical protein
MRIGIATDHGGFSLKEELLGQLRAAGHEVIAFGLIASATAMIILIMWSRSRRPWPRGRWIVAWRSAAAASVRRCAQTKFETFALP